MGLSFTSSTYSSTTTTQTANLLTLPLEVRLKIYHLCFIDPDPFAKPSYVKVDLHSSRILVRPHIWPIFQTSRQIYTEILPEYYSSTEFHFTALAHLRQTTSSHAAFRTHVRHIVLNPNYDLPHLSDLHPLSSLQTFTISNVSCYEPIGTPPNSALSHATLLAVITRTGEDFWATKLTQTRLLYDSLCQDTELVNRGVSLVLRFRYTYVDKTKTNLGVWGPAKRHKIVDYRYRDDVFVVLNPDIDPASATKKDGGDGDDGIVTGLIGGRRKGVITSSLVP